MSSKSGLVSVQFGCGWGSPVPSDWLNFDASPTLRFERLPLVGKLYTKNAHRFPDNIMYGDIVRGLPVERGTVARLYASHVLEHLSYQDALKAIEKSFALLAPGGLFRLIVPDLMVRAERYVAKAVRGDCAAAAEFLDATMLGERARTRGVAAILQRAFGGSAHLWMWDEPALSAALASAGFVEIRRCQFNDSADPAFNAVEESGRFIDDGIVELAMECRRPTVL
jgi:hypothetical protein